jgi:hypothetical protein
MLVFFPAKGLSCYEGDLSRILIGSVIFSTLDPDPHCGFWPGLDPDPHKTDADPKYWLAGQAT